jgi:hypothetical protein
VPDASKGPRGPSTPEALGCGQGARRGMGSAFAALNGNGQDFHRAASYASAIKQGIHEARAHKEREDELTRDQSIPHSPDDALVPLHKDYDSFVGCALMLAGSG